MFKYLLCLILIAAAGLSACRDQKPKVIEESAQTESAEDRSWAKSEQPQSTPNVATPEKPYAFSLTGKPARPPFVGDELTTEQLKANAGKRGVVTLNWSTQSEKATFGYYVTRAEKEDGPFVRINPNLPISAAGESSVARYYAYYDTNVVVGKEYFYGLEEIEMSGKIKSLIKSPKLVVRTLFVDTVSSGTGPTTDSVAQPR